MPKANGAKGKNQQLGLDVLSRCEEEPAPKKKTKPKVAELKKMQNLSEPEYPRLDKLLPDELMDTVASTYYNPRFMQPKIETIISHHWGDIFSRTGYNWRVVLQKPDSVIIYFGNGRAFLCQPFPKCKGMYEAVRLNDKGKVITE